MDDLDKTLIESWLGLSTTQRKGLNALAHEVETSLSLIEASVENLSDKFMNLAFITGDQSEKLTNYVNSFKSLTINDEKIEIETVLNQLSTDLEKSLKRVITFRTKTQSILSKVNRTYNNLHDLYVQTQNDEKYKKALEEFAEIKDVLYEIAHEDVKQDLQTKEQFSHVMAEIIELTKSREKILEKTKRDSEIVSNTIAEIVTQMQFQDRTSQRLSHIGTTLKIMAELLEQKEDHSLENLNITREEIKENQELIDAIIRKMKLSEVRERFIKNTLMSGSDVSNGYEYDKLGVIEFSHASNDIELF